MENRNSSNKTLGIICVIFGALFLASTVFKLVFGGWWALAIVAVGIYGLAKRGYNHNDAILTAIGLGIFLIFRPGIFKFLVFKIAVPVALIGLGCSYISKRIN